ncbi:hypothetical protein AU14_13355 [Marinobacter similis]|uniref:Uncharacterized protein n=1 Tax=Marinobacter similis TaxID=1420916 RepID=W5YM90_9GAMM|nr:hypothetical protein AU14_13355 [Marinobacter similis]
MVSLAYPWLMLLVLVPLLLQWRRPAGHAVDAPMLPVGHWLSDLPGVSVMAAPLLYGRNPCCS